MSQCDYVWNIGEDESLFCVLKLGHEGKHQFSNGAMEGTLRDVQERYDAAVKLCVQRVAEITRERNDARTALERERELTVRDGSFLDKYGCCKVCDGEIPYGHTDECDIWKVEKERNTFDAALAQANVELHRLRRQAEERSALRACVAAADAMDESDGESVPFAKAQKAYGMARAKVKL